MLTRASICGCCPPGGGAADGQGPLEFSGYDHQQHDYLSVDGASLPEIVIVQWAFNWSKIGGAAWQVFLQYVGGLQAGSPVVRYRLREGGIANVADGQIILDTGPVQTNVPGYPAQPTQHCFENLQASANEGPCDLLKLTLEAQSTNPENPEFFDVSTAGIHIDIWGP